MAREDKIELLKKYPEVFEEDLETFKATKAKIVVEGSVSPKYCKARPVPYAIKDKIKKELKRLEKDRTIEQVTFSEWAAPYCADSEGRSNRKNLRGL